MQTSLEQAVKLQMKANSTFGSGPLSLGSEAAAICAVVEKRLTAQAEAHAKAVDALETYHRGAVEELAARFEKQIAELAHRLPKRPCNESYRPQPQ